MKTLLISTLALSVTAGAALAQDVVRMGTEGAYPPYNFIDDNGDVAGYDIDVGNELCARAELNCEWVINDWDSIIPNLVSGNYDTIMAGMSITPEREEVIAFSMSYMPPDPSLFVALDEGIDVSDAVIAVQTGTIHANYVADSGATLVEFSTPDDTVAAVRNGEVDAVFADKAFLQPIVDESDGELVVINDEVSLGNGLGIGIRQSDTELKSKLDAAIQSMKDDGSLNTLIGKWLPSATQF
ncbi:MAG: transporter substrate-binding domain-containing protein [Pseudomonadota bacterium]